MMQPDSNNVIPQVRLIVQTLATLRWEQGRDWFSWREVAKYQEGSEECATLLSAYANLPEAAAYFSQAKDGCSVRLTSAGHSLLHTAEEPALSEPQKVAKAVKAYARQMKPLRFNVLGISAIGKAQRRIVHAVQVALGDALVPNDAPVTLVSREWGTRVSGRIVSQDADEGLIYVALESRFRVGLAGLPVSCSKTSSR
jgi:hypothetical protein